MGKQIKLYARLAPCACVGVCMFAGMCMSNQDCCASRKQIVLMDDDDQPHIKVRKDVEQDE